MKTGDLCNIRGGEVNFEWKIKDFFLLSGKTDTCYESPEFSYSGASWLVSIYPNGQRYDGSVGWVGLYVAPTSLPESVSVDMTLSFKSSDTKSDYINTCTQVFEKTCSGWGWHKFILRSELVRKKFELIPSGVLTILCTLKETETNGVAGNVCIDKSAQTEEATGNSYDDESGRTAEATGFWKLQQDFKEILTKGNVSDVVLKVNAKEFKSHRCVLAARSPVFLAMMTHETKEKNTGVVEIQDVDSNTFSDFLNYLYTGSLDIVSSVNVVEMYTAADKYQVEDLKKLCVDYMLKNISAENFCDIITLSLRYAEKHLTDTCTQFFIENSLAIVLTSKWQVFLAENTVAGNELVIKQMQRVNNRNY